MRVTRPAHLQPRLLALVFLGGACGALSRWGLLEVMSDQYLPIAVANLLGSLLMGLLLGTLWVLGPDDGRLRAVRLALGTGFLGGFTTYSSFASHVVFLGLLGDPVRWFAYTAGSVLGGLALAAIGLWLGRRLGRAMRGRRAA